MVATLTGYITTGENRMAKRKSAKAPGYIVGGKSKGGASTGGKFKNDTGTKDKKVVPYWGKSTNYAGVTGSGNTGETKGKATANQRASRKKSGRRGPSGRQYTNTEKMFIKGLTGSRES